MEATEVVYIDGEAWTRLEAENHLRFLVNNMELLADQGAHQGMTYGRREERFDELKRKAARIEEALGY